MLILILILQLMTLGAVLWYIASHMQKKVKTDKVTNGRRVILDSCALIDGRIIELAKAGFVPEALIIPEFILSELQLLADGNDSHKRERARFGLDVAKELQELKDVQVTLDDAGQREIGTTDEKLVALAIKRGADLYTTDYNLNKVADIRGVRVLNINELAQSLRPVALPGENKLVKILQKGSGQGQGVGYLDDGTMIVVENGAKYIGKKVTVEVTRNLQTVAGKMLFGTLVQPPQQPVNPKDRQSNTPTQRFRTQRKTQPRKANLQ